MPPNHDRPFEPGVFAPPDALEVRRHGPRGYIDDEHYKPWLRDEFTYRCLYYGCREVWFPDGDRSFSVEHLRPTSLAPEGLTEYDTLVYACCQCNAARGAIRLPLDPAAGMRQHVEVSADGTIRGLTPAGEDLIRICRLDRPNLVAFRRLILDALRLLGRKRDREAAALRRRYLGYPANLPDLSTLKPAYSVTFFWHPACHQIPAYSVTFLLTRGIFSLDNSLTCATIFARRAKRDQHGRNDLVDGARVRNSLSCANGRW